MRVLGEATVLGADPVPITGQALAVVAIVLVVLVASAWVLARANRLRRTGRPVSVETAVPLGERRSLVIVEVEGRRLLLGLTPGQITLVTELQRPFREALEASVAKGGPS